MRESRLLTHAPNLGLLAALAVVMMLVAGCGGGGGTTATETGFPASLTNYHSPAQWCELIETAGLEKYAELGRKLEREGKIKFVKPPTLDAGYNAFSWIDEGEIWINSPLFANYPQIRDQAEIFLHELIHIDSGEATHEGPWWSAQAQFRAYFASE